MRKLLLSLALIFTSVGYNLSGRKTQASFKSGEVNPSAAPSVPYTVYKDGIYTGDVVDVFYGNIQVQAKVISGRISQVGFLQYPNDRRTSVEINSQAMPILQSEAIQAQTGQVDIVSGATATSQGFILSLSSALNQAR